MRRLAAKRCGCDQITWIAQARSTKADPDDRERGCEEGLLGRGMWQGLIQEKSCDRGLLARGVRQGLIRVSAYDWRWGVVAV
eukprot:3806808-Rhodomonas_salina.1